MEFLLLFAISFDVKSGFSVYELECNLFISLELKAIEGFLLVVNRVSK